MSATSVFSRTFVSAAMTTVSRKAIAAAVAIVATASMMPETARSQDNVASNESAIEVASAIVRNAGNTKHKAANEELDSASVDVAVQRITAEAAHDAFAATKQAMLDQPNNEARMKAAERMHTILSYEVATLNVLLAAMENKLSQAEKTHGKESMLQYRALLESSSTPIDMRAAEILRNATLHAHAMSKLKEGPGGNVIVATPKNSAYYPASQSSARQQARP